MISKLAMLAKKTIEAAWLNGPSYDLATQAAEALESAQLLQSPETAASADRVRAELVQEELAYERLRVALESAKRGRRELWARVAELEANPLAWAERLDLKTLDNFLVSLGSATEHEPMDGAIEQIHELIRAFREAAGVPAAEAERARTLHDHIIIRDAEIERLKGRVERLQQLLAGQRAAAEADGITRRIAPTQALRADVPAALRAEDTADLLTLAPAQHADSSYDAAFQTISLELTATPEQWALWQKALSVDLARTTNRGPCVTSHAVWRGIHVVICCWLAKEAGE